MSKERITMRRMKAVVKERPEAAKEWPKGLDFVEKEIPEVKASNEVKMKVIEK